MRRKWGDSITNMATKIIFFILLSTSAFSTCDGVRRTAQRRKDTSRSRLYAPTPSAESLQALAEAMGAAGFEHYTEGRALVKRLIPADSQPDLDVVEHQGVIGKAGVDFPAFPNIPSTGFNCKNVPTGYYADLETDCQVFHICDTSRKISFLCPNGTIFSQSHLICDWWFKVDCASAPALYESSAEYYSNEQKKTHKVSQNLRKNADLQHIGESNSRAESRRNSFNIPTTTERFRTKQRFEFTPLDTVKTTARSFPPFFSQNYNPTQRTQASTAFEKRRRNLVQLITNKFGNTSPRTTIPTYTESSTYRSTAPAGDYNSLKEMQVAAESASFAHNNNRQFLQDYKSKNYRPYPVYTPNPTAKSGQTKSDPTLTTLYDIRDKQLNEAIQETTTKRPTLIPYTKSYTTTFDDRHEPYTRPGVSLLKDFLEKEKNKTLTTTTESTVEITEKGDTDFIDNNKENLENKVTIDTRYNFESATKIPQTTRAETTYFTQTPSSDKLGAFSSTKYFTQITTEPSYQERRERLLRKLNFDNFGPTEATLSTSPSTITEKYYGDLPNRPGLIVPPSLTPKTLHSLAIYYATALDNLSTTSPPEEAETTTLSTDQYETLEDGLPPLFSRHTINKYSKLFGHGMDNPEILEEIKFDPNGTYNELEDLMVQQSQNPLATSPQIRELAQVFTHALSAYLQDPVQFRKVLSDIRPTHPSFGDMLTTTEDPSNTEPTTTINEEDEEILGFSDDNKIRPALISLRDSKALNIASDFPSISEEPATTVRSITTESVSTTTTTTPRSPFKCCGKISASYTTASIPVGTSTTPLSFLKPLVAKINVSSNSEALVSTTESNYEVPKFGGFQNNAYLPYGEGVNPTNAKPLNEYVEATNLPTAWGVDVSESTALPITETHVNSFESKRIKTTTILPSTTPVYFTETGTFELENEEELQRAHSQSFVNPQINLRQGKQINLEKTKIIIKKPSEELEAPTLPDVDTTTIQTTTPPSTTIKLEETESPTTASSIYSSIFTSPDNEKTTNQLQWSSTYENWQSTIIDPITLNEGLTATGQEQTLYQIARQTNPWISNAATTPSIEYGSTSEQALSSTIDIEQTTPSNRHDDRNARLLKESTSTEAIQDLTTIADTVVEKAKEIMEGMNATTTEKLMNVMKKTKSKTVKRLILLLVQTCDDDHNTTAEASKKALLEALMAISQQDMDEIAGEEGITEAPITVADHESLRTTNSHRRMDRILARQTIPTQSGRRGKSINFDPRVINSLSNPTTTEKVGTTTEVVTETAPTTQPTTTLSHLRNTKRVKLTTVEPITTKAPFFDIPRAEARVASEGSDLKTASDTRALELLRSLYSIASRWG